MNEPQKPAKNVLVKGFIISVAGIGLGFGTCTTFAGTNITLLTNGGLVLFFASLIAAIAFGVLIIRAIIREQIRRRRS